MTPGPSIDLVPGIATQGSSDAQVAVSLVLVPGINATAAEVARVLREVHESASNAGARAGSIDSAQCGATIIGGSLVSGVRDVLEPAAAAEAVVVPPLPSATPSPTTSPTPSTVSNSLGISFCLFPLFLSS